MRRQTKHSDVSLITDFIVIVLLWLSCKNMDQTRNKIRKHKKSVAEVMKTWVVDSGRSYHVRHELS